VVATGVRPPRLMRGVRRIPMTAKLTPNVTNGGASPATALSRLRIWKSIACVFAAALCINIVVGGVLTMLGRGGGFYVPDALQEPIVFTVWFGPALATAAFAISRILKASTQVWWRVRAMLVVTLLAFVSAYLGMLASVMWGH